MYILMLVFLILVGKKGENWNKSSNSCEKVTLIPINNSPTK